MPSNLFMTQSLFFQECHNREWAGGQADPASINKELIFGPGLISGFVCMHADVILRLGIFPPELEFSVYSYDIGQREAAK